MAFEGFNKFFKTFGYISYLKELHHSHSDERSLSLTQRSYINLNSLKIFIVPKKASPLHIIGTTL